uniref:cadherin-like beta sandwich domain-containing protein n=1 Tax=Flavobacterium sp. UGB4466 TaxID=2730889 RepID=UPI00192B627C
FYGASGHTYYLRTVNSGNSATLTTPENVATLSNISLSAGALTTVFSSGTTDYIANVPNAVSSIMLTPVTTDTHATVKVNGVAVTSGNPSQVIGNLEVNNVDAKANRIAIEVTAQDGTVKTYTIKVFRLLAPPTIQATNLTFTKTTMTSTTLKWTNGNGVARTVFMREGAISSNPVPDNIYFKDDQTFGKGDQIGTTGWYAIVKTNEGNAVDINGLSPGKTYQAMVMEFNGSPGNPLFLTTTSTANPATVTTLSNVATLSNINLSAGALTTVFSSEATDYVANVPNEVSSITVRPITTDAHATVKVNGVAVVSGSSSQVFSNLEVGNFNAASNLIRIEVTAQSGAVKTYTINIYRLYPPPTIQATNLTFTKTTGTSTTLNWTNGNGVARAVFMCEGATSSNPVPDNIYFKDNQTFGKGDQIGTTGWYTILKTNNSNKIEITITGLTPGKTYQAMVMEAYGDVDYPSYLTTTSTGNPATVTTLSNVATLSNVSLSAGALTTVFSSEATDYVANVPNEVSSITVRPITTDAHATVKVNGVAVVSGNPSQVIGNLKEGFNFQDLITIEVTAQSGAVKTYTINIYRLYQPPTVQASNLTFTNTTGTSTTLNWTNGNGAVRTVFMREGAGSAAVPDNIYFKDDQTFGKGDQIGTTGWYTIFKTNNSNKIEITGLTPGKTYQAMVMELNIEASYPSYLTTTGTGNPATVTTLSNVATLSNVSLSAGALTTVFSPETTVYTAKVPNEVSSIMLTPVTTDSHATIKVNGVAVASGNPSQKIDLASGAGTTVITIEVLAQDGTAKTYTVTVEKSSLGVVDNKMEGFVVYPNPVQKGMLYIQTKSTAVKNVKIFDMSGKMVLSVQTTKDEIAVEGLQKGVYVLKVNQEGAESTEKLVVE